MPDLVLTYAQCLDRIIVGGKAQRLGDLHRASILVPPGVVVPTTVCEHALKISGLPEHDPTPHAQASKPYQISPKQRKAFLSARVFDGLQTALASHLNDLDTDSYAVRSSAPVEDSKLHPFAGLFDSFLHISPREIVGAIKRCMLSSFNNRAISYSRQMGIVLDFRMAVLIQPMIYGDYSGVVFTVSPANRHELVIEVVKGLCDKLVLGQVSPVRYDIHRESGEIKGQAVSEFNISSELIQSIYQTSMLVENLFGTPQDIEFVIQDAKVVIVQSRDIPLKSSFGKS